MKMQLQFSVTKKQKLFIDATESEVLFGGAAGGGKSYGQMVDALLFALRYPGSKQLVLRRTFAELDKSLIRLSLSMFPNNLYFFNSSSHTGKFSNGSCVDFGYCATENDVYQYQSAEYDVIRFDELTHFTESQYIYLISRVRGANPYPKQIKSSTNPGGIGHGWVKRRFVDASEAGKRFTGDDGMERIFIPALLDDNKFLLEGDPKYKERLLALPEREKKALLYGDWDIFEGQYFTEWKRDTHVIAPFEIPKSWRKFRTIDYGLDRLACLWIAINPEGKFFVYREYCQSNLSISAAARAILERTPENEEIYATLALYEEERRKIKGEDIEALREFCLEYSRDELEYRRRSFITSHALSTEKYKRYLMGEGVEAKEAKIFKKASKIKAIPISPKVLLTKEKGGGKSELISPEKYKLISLIVRLIPTTVCMCVTVSVILKAKSGLDAAAIIEGILKLSALPIVGFRGYVNGYSYVKKRYLPWIETKKRLLEAFGEKKALST